MFAVTDGAVRESIVLEVIRWMLGEFELIACCAGGIPKNTRTTLDNWTGSHHTASATSVGSAGRPEPPVKSSRYVGQLQPAWQVLRGKVLPKSGATTGENDKVTPHLAAPNKPPVSPRTGPNSFNHPHHPSIQT